MAKADDKTNTQRIWLCQGWALVAKAYGDLTERVLTEALAEGRVRSWDGSDRPIKPEFWRLDLQIDWPKNSARERTYSLHFFGGPSSGRVTGYSPPAREHRGITLARADVLAAGEAAPSKSRARYRRGPVDAVVEDLWPEGVPGPETESTPDLMKKLGGELQRRGIKAPSDDTLRRALDRR